MLHELSIFSHFIALHHSPNVNFQKYLLAEGSVRVEQRIIKRLRQNKPWTTGLEFTFQRGIE